MSIESTRIDLNHEKQNLDLKDIKPVSQSINRLKSLYGNRIFSYSMKQEEKIEFISKHCVFNGFVAAFKEHRPITISPDIIWLLIIQGFANHINNNSEKFRSKLVGFKGKKNLSIKRENLTPQTATIEDWNDIFSEFNTQISTFTGEEITKALEPCFTTTTPISKAVGNLSIMSAMKNFFSYETMMCSCHFPYIIIEGTTSDWEKISSKLDQLRNFDLDFWVNELQPIIGKIIDTTKGAIDKKFWNNMIHITPNGGPYKPGCVNGWFVNFFLYNEFGKIIHGTVKENDELASEMLTVPFTLTTVNDANTVSFNCEFVAGFVGLSQDEENRSVKPEIGWIIRGEDRNKERIKPLDIDKKRKSLFENEAQLMMMLDNILKGLK